MVIGVPQFQHYMFLNQNSASFPFFLIGWRAVQNDWLGVKSRASTIDINMNNIQKSLAQFDCVRPGQGISEALRITREVILAMRIYYIGVFRSGGEKALELSEVKDLSQFGFFERSSVGQFMTFLLKRSLLELVQDKDKV